MIYRSLGKSNLRVSGLCLGTMMFGDQTAREEAGAIVADAREHGVNYLDTYHHHGLVGSRTVLAHNVHPTDHELEMMAGTGCWVAHCPTSNAALGSGLFPFRRHDAYGVGVALGSDVGAGTGFCLIKEGLQAYFAQQLLGPGGLPIGVQLVGDDGSNTPPN